MRARHRLFLSVLAAAVLTALAAQPAHSATTPAGTQAREAVTCPSGTAWDNFLQRCV